MDIIPDFKWLGVGGDSVITQLVLRFDTMRFNPEDSDVWSHKGALAGSDSLLEKVVNGFYEVIFRAVVGAKRCLVIIFDLAGGLVVSEDIATAEAVDRLFGVANHEKGGVTAAKEGLKNLILDRISILKLINQRSFKLSS